MEDNNYRHEEFDNCFLCKHPALKHVLVGLLVFLGAFCAFYVVADWHFKRMTDPVYQMRKMDRAILQREKHFDKIAQKAFSQEQRMAKSSAQFVSIERMPDAYRFVIDLRPFGDDEKNVEVRTQGNNLSINAVGERNSRNKEELVRYSQSFAFTENVNMDEITKVREGHNYIITIPIN